jgi:dihydroxy-acid dehydratase
LVEIDIPNRLIRVLLSEEELGRRRNEELSKGELAFTPEGRKRTVSQALKAYSLMAGSADKGAIRIIPPGIERK